MGLEINGIPVKGLRVMGSGGGGSSEETKTSHLNSVENPFDAFTLINGAKMTADVINNWPGTTVISINGRVKALPRNTNTVFSGKKYLWISFQGDMNDISCNRASFVDFTERTIGFDGSANCPTVTLVHKTEDVYTLTVDSPINDAFSADVMYELDITATVK